MTMAHGGWLAFLALLAFVGPPGSLDATFGDGGAARAAFAGEGASAFDIASTASGGYLVAGVATVNGHPSFALLQVTADGEPDPAFGSGGTVTTAFAGMDAAAAAVVVLADGDFVVGGSAGASAATDLAVARYLPDGRLDPLFGDGGKVVLDIGGDNDTLAGVEALPGGSILIAATVVRDGREAVLIRLDASGALDPNFGDSGIATVATPSGNDEAFDLAIDPTEHILVTGRTTTVTSDDLLLARFTSTGEPDASFGDGGVVVTDVRGGSDTSFAVQVAGDGRILLSGGSIVGDLDEATVAAYTPAGQLDETFGDGGIILVDVTPGSDEVFAGILAPDGSFVAAGGAIAEDGSEQGFVIRVLGNGHRDASFGDGGKLLTGDATGVEEIRGLALDSRGKIVSAGRSLSPGARSSFVVYRVRA